MKVSELIAALRHFNLMDNKMQVSTALTFLEIAAAEDRGEDIGIKEIAQRIGLFQGTSSRNVSYWAQGTTEVIGKHEMVSIDFDPSDRRLRRLTLTPKGRAFVSALQGDKDNGNS